MKIIQKKTGASTPNLPARTDKAVDLILNDPHWRVNGDVRQPLRLGRWALAGVVVIFFIWASFAPISQGVPVNGYVRVDGDSKAVQHLKGGIVDEILVREGDAVKAGQPLMRLNGVQIRAQMGVIDAQLISVMAVDARLQAEREGRAAVVFPQKLLVRKDAESLGAMGLQQHLFTSRTEALKTDERAIRETIVALEAQIRGFAAQEKAKGEQIRLFDEEYRSLIPSYEQGFVPKNRMSEMERTLAMLGGQRGEDLANVGKARAQIAEAKQRIILAKQNYMKDVETQQTESHRQVDDLSQRYLGLKDDLDQSVIKAPVSGVVAGLTVKTEGGVSAPGQKLMDIVPEGLPFVIEVQIPTHLIDNVRVGLIADVHFQALDTAVVPVVVGTLKYVSADKQQEPNRPEVTYFLGRVSLDSANLQKLGKHEVRVGMPADVVIKTGERTLLGYLLKPALARLQMSFKER
jgi:protease secretion system membrane fusion protein